MILIYINKHLTYTGIFVHKHVYGNITDIRGEGGNHWALNRIDGRREDSFLFLYRLIFLSSHYFNKYEVREKVTLKLTMKVLLKMNLTRVSSKTKVYTEFRSDIYIRILTADTTKNIYPIIFTLEHFVYSHYLNISTNYLQILLNHFKTQIKIIIISDHTFCRRCFSPFTLSWFSFPTILIQPLPQT